MGSGATENPRVGGSIPPLATNKSMCCMQSMWTVSTVLAVEFVVALPKERALWRKMGDPASADAATLEQMRACIRVALYSHLAIAAVLICLAARV